MSIGRSKEEQELTALLSKTLVQKEVMEPMSKIGWSHAAPPPPDYSGQPAPAEGAPGQAAAPAAKPADGQPVQKVEQPAPPAEPKADGPAPTTAESLISQYEALRDPETGLIMKKYKSVEEAIKGSGHLANMSKQAFQERDAALAEVARLRAESAQLRAPAAPPQAAASVPNLDSPPSRERLDQAQARLDAVLSGIVENGGVLDTEAANNLSKAQREVADAAAEFRAQELRLLTQSEKTKEETDRTEWTKVDAYMAEYHPAAARFSEEVALHIQSDPLLGSAVSALLAQGKKLEATELAWKSFERIHGEQVAAADRAKAEVKESDLAAREQVRKEQVEQARKDAGIVTGSPGGAGAHENRNAAGASREEIQAAMEQMRREGDAPGSPAAKRFRDMVIGPSLDPAFFPELRGR